jgi:hypothetical protein
MDKKKQQEDWFDKVDINEFMHIVNETNIFNAAAELKDRFNIICAVKDRILSCIAFLNKYNDYPESEEDFIHFLTFACILKDAVYSLLKELDIEKPEFDQKQKETKFFTQTKVHWDMDKNEDKKARLLSHYPTDDKFFEYFRSLAFAHPLGTDRAKFLLDNEKQYSPFVVVNKSLQWDLPDDFGNRLNCYDKVGIRVYSNAMSVMGHVDFSFKTVKAYIKDRYSLLHYAKDWGVMKYEEYKEKWKQHKINRNASDVEILNEVKQKMIERFDRIECGYDDGSGPHWIEQAITYLTVPITDKQNIENVTKFRAYISSQINDLCDAVDNLDWENIGINDSPYPENTFNEFGYAMEKINSHLAPFHLNGKYRDNQSSDNFKFGLWQLEVYYSSKDSFARKYINLDFLKTVTNFTEDILNEIILLVHTANYCERLSQEKQ